MCLTVRCRTSVSEPRAAIPPRFSHSGYPLSGMAENYTAWSRPKQDTRPFGAPDGSYCLPALHHSSQDVWKERAVEMQSVLHPVPSLCQTTLLLSCRDTRFLYSEPFYGIINIFCCEVEGHFAEVNFSCWIRERDQAWQRACSPRCVVLSPLSSPLMYYEYNVCVTFRKFRSPPSCRCKFM